MMSKNKVYGIGEVLWDILPEGKQLGGAPTNFVYHTHNLGANSTIISAIGNDDLGNEIKQALKHKEIDNVLSISSAPTGTVSVELSEGIPEYTIHEKVAWDNIELTNAVKSELHSADAICFGSLAQRSQFSRLAIKEAVTLVPDSALKVFDINLRQNYYTKDLIAESLQLANILKLNTEELQILSDFFDLESDQTEACSSLQNLFGLKLIALTNGSENSMLVTQGKTSVLTTPKVEVIDTVGAGDSFTAALVRGLLKNESLEMIHQIAVNYSAKVCMSEGATPDIVF
jgi:fructokinase